MNSLPKTCLIIGGGMSGLMAGTVLHRQGIQVTVLDKGRGIGGRLATRRISHPVAGEGVFDYGAQFFSVSEPVFQTWVEEWLQEGVIGEWPGLTQAGKPCYRGVKSNRSIAQSLAENLTIHTQMRVVQVTWDSAQWFAQVENGTQFQADALIITAPIPQSLALLDAAAIALPLDLRHRLEQVSYQPCIAILALLEQPSQIPLPGGLRLNTAELAWIACNEQKGISARGHAVTLLATPEFSQDFWEMDNRVIAEALLEDASAWLGSPVIDVQVHRWRYSQPQACFGEPYLARREPGRFVLAGDAFSSTLAGDSSLNLEKAALSGLAAADYLLARL
jgi:renalase